MLPDKIQTDGVGPDDIHSLEDLAKFPFTTNNDLRQNYPYGMFGGEPWSEELRREIEKRLNIVATDNHELSEIVGPGVAGECLCKKGMHIFEDHFIPEIINPESGEVLPAGEKGELVLTNIVQEAIPLIRYRTRDITRLLYGKCECGRTLVRMEKTMGRSDDMLIIKGVNVFPAQIEEVLFQVEGCEPHYRQ